MSTYTCTPAKVAEHCHIDECHGQNCRARSGTHVLAAERCNADQYPSSYMLLPVALSTCAADVAMAVSDEHGNAVVCEGCSGADVEARERPCGS